MLSSWTLYSVWQNLLDGNVGYIEGVWCDGIKAFYKDTKACIIVNREASEGF